VDEVDFDPASDPVFRAELQKLPRRNYRQ
jgi:hypothetical protein